LGDLFAWIDANFHDHGGQPWAALQVGMEGQPFAGLALRLMEFDNIQPLAGPIAEEETLERDLRVSLRGLHLDALADEIARTDKLPKTDPARFERLMELSRKQQTLLSQKDETNP
jgi:DNA primase